MTNLHWSLESDARGPFRTACGCRLADDHAAGARGGSDVSDSRPGVLLAARYLGEGDPDEEVLRARVDHPMASVRELGEFLGVSADVCAGRLRRALQRGAKREALPAPSGPVWPSPAPEAPGAGADLGPARTDPEGVFLRRGDLVRGPGDHGAHIVAYVQGGMAVVLCEPVAYIADLSKSDAHRDEPGSRVCRGCAATLRRLRGQPTKSKHVNTNTSTEEDAA